jgi:hypothetical protein
MTPAGGPRLVTVWISLKRGNKCNLSTCSGMIRATASRLRSDDAARPNRERPPSSGVVVYGGARSNASVMQSQQPVGRLRTLIRSSSLGRRTQGRRHATGHVRESHGRDPSCPTLALSPPGSGLSSPPCHGDGPSRRRTELLMCRGLATLIARSYPAEELCETYHVTPEQLSRAAMVPVFSSTFEPLAAGR